jgi:hypothetical protein
MTYQVEFRSPNPVDSLGYRYWVERDGTGKVSAWQQPLKGGEPDPEQRPEPLRVSELPSGQLRNQFHMLSEGALPAVA